MPETGEAQNVRSAGVECTLYFCGWMCVVAARRACWAARMSGRGRGESRWTLWRKEREEADSRARVLFGNEERCLFGVNPDSD